VFIKSKNEYGSVQFLKIAELYCLHIKFTIAVFCILYKHKMNYMEH